MALGVALHIDFIITELFVGGAERCLTELAIGLARQGDRVRVGSIGSLPTGEQAPLVDRLKREGIETFSTNCDHWSQFFRARAKFKDWLREGQPDVVQTMLVHANIVGTLAADAARVQARVGGVRVAERSRVRNSVEAWAMKRMSAVVCVSDAVRRFVQATQQTTTQATTRANGQQVHAPLHVIPNAIDLHQVDTTKVADWGLVASQLADARKDVLLFVGRLHPQKGLDVLLSALPELLTRHSDMNVVIVGDGPLRKSVESNAAQIDPKRIAVVGWRNDALSLIKSCRLLVLPSRFEGMPNVVMEAMAAGKPIAGTRVEGFAELLRHNADEQTCVPNDVDALRALLDRLWGDADRARLLGSQNRQLIVENHSLTAMINAYRALYLSILTSER